MKLARHILASLTLGLAALLFLPQGTLAAASCQFGEQIKALNAARENSAAGKREDALTELELRKTILKDTVDCAREDAKKLKATVQELPENDQELTGLKKLYVNKLEEAESYYQVQRERISDLGLKGSKDLARNLGDWRTGNYGPLADGIGNLILWVKNQNLFPVAENRYTQIDKNLKGLQLDQSEDIQALLAQARTDLTAAENLNAQAKTALASHFRPSDTGDLIKQSLDKLSATYQDFFDITQEVKKLLPL